MKKPLRVAIVAPPFGPTGGPEIVAQNLTDALLKKGVDVTLFAPADWKTKAKHIATLPQSLWNMKNFKEQTGKVRRNLIISSQIKVLNFQDQFDLIHLHSQTYAYCVAQNAAIPCVLSYHNKITRPEFEQFKKTGAYTVSLSKSQKGGLKTNATIWNGLPIESTSYSYTKDTFLITVGRINDQKGIDTAIEIAQKAGKKLLIFGRIGNSPERQIFFNEKVKPHLNKQIVYMGEVSHQKLLEYFRDAAALLFPIRRPEVCPLVIQEALASGTPVIGTTVEPLPELLKNRRNSFLSDNMSELVAVTRDLSSFDNAACRTYAEKYFDSSVMAEKYIKLYKKMLAG